MVIKTIDEYSLYMEGYKNKMNLENTGGLEKDLQRKVVKWARERGFPLWHDRSRGKNQAGWPDVILIMPGEVFFIELKSVSGKLRKEQKELKLQFKFLGHEIHVVRSFRQFLNLVDQKKG